MGDYLHKNIKSHHTISNKKMSCNESRKSLSQQLLLNFFFI